MASLTLVPLKISKELVILYIVGCLDPLGKGLESVYFWLLLTKPGSCVLDPIQKGVSVTDL